MLAVEQPDELSVGPEEPQIVGTPSAEGFPDSAATSLSSVRLPRASIARPEIASSFYAVDVADLGRAELLGEVSIPVDSTLLVARLALSKTLDRTLSYAAGWRFLRHGLVVAGVVSEPEPVVFYGPKLDLTDLVVPHAQRTASFLW